MASPTTKVSFCPLLTAASAHNTRLEATLFDVRVLRLHSFKYFDTQTDFRFSQQEFNEHFNIVQIFYDVVSESLHLSPFVYACFFVIISFSAVSGIPYVCMHGPISVLLVIRTTVFFLFCFLIFCFSSRVQKL